MWFCTGSASVESIISRASSDDIMCGYVTRLRKLPRAYIGLPSGAGIFGVRNELFELCVMNIKCWLEKCCFAFVPIALHYTPSFVFIHTDFQFPKCNCCSSSK